MALLLWLMTVSAFASAPADELDALVRQMQPEPALALAEGGALPEIQAALAANSTAAPVMAWALAQHPVPEAREALEQALRSNDQRLGYWAAFALGILGDERSAAPLAAVLPKTDEPKQYWELAYWTPEGWISQFERRYEPNGNVLIPPAPEGVPNLRTAYASLEALGMIGGPIAKETLTRMLRSDQWLIRYGAVRGIQWMGLESARGEVARLAAADPTLVVRRAGGNSGTPYHPQTSESSRVSPNSHSSSGIAFIKAEARTESSLGFQDSYFFPKTPWYHWGQNIWTLTPATPDGKLVNLTGFEEARVQGLEASYDGGRLLFSLCDDREKTGFHVCEINADGTGFRQITRGNCNDVDPCYLPDGRIAFSSDRSGHHEYYHQERSRNLYVMDADGANIERITFNPNQDYAPYVLSSGLIAYTSYRFYGQDGSGNIYGRDSDLNRIETQLRAVNPDGTGDHLLYGAMRGGFYVPLRPLPDSLQDSGSPFRRGTDQHIGASVSWVRELPDGRLACVTPAGLTLLDLTADPLSCELPFFPEIVNLAGGEEVYIHSHDELNPVGRYTSPYPADDGRLFVAYAPFWDTGFDAYGLYLFDLETRELTLVHDEPGVSDVDPVVLAPRPLPHKTQPNLTHREQSTGTVLCVSVFNSDLEYDRQAARYVRVLGVTLMGQTINANAAFETEVLGTLPLQADGSFKVEVPADRPVRFQLLDADENLLLHETEFNYVRGGETLSCVGCHEPKGRTPPTMQPLAAALPPYPALGSPGNLRYHGRVGRGYNGVARP
jgi:HEAT repeat protein